MDNLSSFRISSFKRLHLLKVLILISVTIWVADFWFFNDFGFYEDDYTRITKAMNMDFSELWNAIITSSYTQGRPLHDTMIYLFSFLGSKSGGLSSLYIIDFFIITTNAFLFYLLLKRLLDQPLFTITGTLAFCVFPANTTQAWLTAAFGIQPSLTFLLIAFHCYLSKRYKLSYIFALGCLLCYETFFPVFIAAPLLRRRWNSKIIGEFIKHILIWGFILAIVVSVRKLAINTTGVMNIGVTSALRVAIRSMFYGPIIGIGSFLSRSIDISLLWDFRNYTIQYIPWRVATNIFFIFIPFCLASFYWIFSGLKYQISEENPSFIASFKGNLFRLEMELPKFVQPLPKLLGIGLVMTIFAYPLGLTMSPLSIYGRDTRIHLPAVIGVSIIYACIFSTILFFASTLHKNKKLITILTISSLYALMVGNHLVVQNDYKTSWQYQRAFWTDVIRLSPDIADGTQIFVEDRGLRSPQQITANAWATLFILEQVYQFPKEWKTIPRLYFVPSGWQDKIVVNQGLLDSESKDIASSEKSISLSALVGAKHKIESSNVIFLTTQDGKLIRKHESLIISGKEFLFKKPSASLSLDKGYLYSYLIMNDNEQPINYILP